MMNSNPETVSTDYDTSSRLYFEPLTIEDVLNVIEKERPEGIIIQFGGQTPLKLANAIQSFLEQTPLPASSGEFACMMWCPIGLAITSLLPDQPAILTETLALLKLAHASQNFLTLHPKAF